MKIKSVFSVLIATLIISSCSSIVTATPNEPVLPTVISSPTKTPILTALPTIKPTDFIASPLSLESKYQLTLPQAPSGFSWKVIPEYKLAVLIPNNWFFKQQDVFDMNVVGEVDISREKFSENKNYFTGMAVVEFASDNPNELATSLLTEYIDANAITKTTGPWDSQINGRNAQNIKFKANFPDRTDTIIQLSVITSHNWVYLVILQSPSALWKELSDNYDVMLNQVTIFDE